MSENALRRLYVLFMAYWARDLVNQNLRYSPLKPNTKKVTVSLTFKADATNFVSIIKPTEYPPNFWRGFIEIGKTIKLEYYFVPKAMKYPQLTMSFCDNRDITSYSQIEMIWGNIKT